MTRSGSFDQIVSNRLAEPRFQTQLMGAFALVALLSAVVGIYGVNAYAVMRRRNEIGLQMALGATPMQVLSEIMKQGMLLTTIGIAIGLAGAIAIASLLKSVVVGVSATDPVTLGGVSILLAAVACYVPARRATYIDPRSRCGGNKSAIQWASKKGAMLRREPPFLVLRKTNTKPR